ncbi:MAG: CAAX prenyl protease-related protein [Planctomycetota bacterium]|nr:CAAX prenyl protease-related protein [Planctomycetota bacterium]
MSSDQSPVKLDIPAEKRWERDELAYFTPMATFLGFTYLGTYLPSLFPYTYIVKTLLTGALLIAFRRHYTKIKWNYASLGLILGIIGVIQWVGMEKGLLHYWPKYPRMSGEIFNPYDKIKSPVLLWTFLAVRLVGPALVVPFMEELFWRDFLWRTIIAPNDFKMARVGEIDWQAFLLVTLFFASVHIQWMTAIVWGIMIGLLLITTRSLGACILMHGITNLLLGIYVLHTHDWWFW